jgi:DNA modification methylase
MTHESLTMTRITREDFYDFVKASKSVTIEEVEVPIGNSWSIKSIGPPHDYRPETTTVWSFPDRGDWATHAGNYRGNWSPYIPRNLILRYTKPGELVLDQMVGSGTTLVECKLLGRDAIGVDVNPDALMVAWDRINFRHRPLDEDYREGKVQIYLGNARNLDQIQDQSIDLIATHPPYAGIIRYTGVRVPGDLSALKMSAYVDAMRQVAAESYRVLKPGKHCAILIGDTRQHKHYVPISSRVLEQFLDVGFIIREDIIKLQHKMKSTRERWRGKKYDFYLIGHEHLYVFRKPTNDERPSAFRNSRKWWSEIVPVSSKSKESRQT